MDKQIIKKFYRVMDMIKRTLFSADFFCELSRSEFSALQFIQELGDDNKIVTTSALSKYLDISKPAVSQIMRVLERKKYIERTINQEDRRGICITLTKIGEEKLKKEREHCEVFLTMMFDKMGEEDAEQFIMLLEKCFKTVKEVMQEEG